MRWFQSCGWMVLLICLWAPQGWAATPVALGVEGAPSSVVNSIEKAIRSKLRGRSGLRVLPKGMQLSMIRLTVGCVDDSAACLSNLGGTLGAKQLFHLRLLPMGSRVRAIFRRIDIGKKKVTKQVKAFIRKSNVNAGASTLYNQMFAVGGGGGTTAAALAAKKAQAQKAAKAKAAVAKANAQKQAKVAKANVKRKAQQQAKAVAARKKAANAKALAAKNQAQQQAKAAKQTQAKKSQKNAQALAAAKAKQAAAEAAAAEAAAAAAKAKAAAAAAEAAKAKAQALAKSAAAKKAKAKADANAQAKAAKEKAEAQKQAKAAKAKSDAASQAAKKQEAQQQAKASAAAQAQAAKKAQAQKRAKADAAAAMARKAKAQKQAKAMTAARRQPPTRRVDFREVPIRPAGRKVAVAPRTRIKDPQPPQRVSLVRRPFFWALVLTGVGVGALGATAAFGFDSQDKEQQVSALIKRSQQGEAISYKTQVSPIQEQGESSATAANISLGVAAVALVGAVVLFLMPEPKPESPAQAKRNNKHRPIAGKPLPPLPHTAKTLVTQQ